MVTLVKGSDAAHKQVMFIPYMNRSIDNLIDKLPMKHADVFSGLHYLRVAEIAEMTESFWNLSGQLSKFVVDWMLKESSTKQR